MDRYRIALIVDHPMRDLAGMVLIGVELAKLGAEVSLVPMCVQRNEIFAQMPDFVLLNYVRQSNSKFVQDIRECGISYGLLETEGGFFGDMNAYGRLFPENKELIQDIKVHCIWGEKMARWWRKEMKFFDSAKLIVTGLPRYDWYSENMVESGVAIGSLDSEYVGKSILINSKVTLANPKFVSLNIEKKIYSDLGFSTHEIAEFIRLGELTIKGMSLLTKHIAEKHKNKTCIFRPHPHENPKRYLKEFKKIKAPNNIVINQNGSVIPLINASKVLIHRQCMTGIESVIAGKQSISPQWIPTSSNVPSSELLSHRVNSYEELDEFLELGLNGKLSLTPQMERDKNKIINDWLYSIDGLAASRAAYSIFKVLCDRRKVNVDKCLEKYYEVNGTSPVKIIYKITGELAKRGIAKPKKVSDQINNMRKVKSGKSFTEQDVQRIVSVLKIKDIICKKVKPEKVANHNSASILIVKAS